MPGPEALISELFVEHSGVSQPHFYDGKERVDGFLVRVDPLSHNVSKISEARARILPGINVDLTIKPSDECVFCDYRDKTPVFIGDDGSKYRIFHQGGAVTVPNLNPWEAFDAVTMYPPFDKKQPHKLATHFCYEDFQMLIHTHYELAGLMQRKDVHAMQDFTNWGPYAGASQPHPHSQRKSISFVMDPRQARELLIAKEYHKATGKNIYGDYATHELQDGRRVIHSDGTFIAAEFAPQFEHGIIMFPNYPVSNILQMPENDRRALISATGTIPGLVFYCGVTSFNIAIHQAPFPDMEEARDYFRWHMHVWPRRATVNSDRAGAEVGYETNIIPTFPETTAQNLGRWYRERPNPEYVMKNRQGQPCEQLVKELQSVAGQR